MSENSPEENQKPSVDGMTDAEVTEIIEKTCWRSHPALGAYIDGKGSIAERRAALQCAYNIEWTQETENDQRVARNLTEDDALEPLYAKVHELATIRLEQDGSKSLGSHVRELAKRIDLHLAALADTFDAAL